MSDKNAKLTPEEMKLIEETESFMKEVYSDPEIANAQIPESLRANVFREIRAKEENQESERVLTEEEQELIYLGKKYKKQLKFRKYMVLAAALVLALAFSITSMGGPEKLWEKVNWMIADREQLNVDSDDEEVKPIIDITEDEMFEQIEDAFGFNPVKIGYTPKGVKYVEGQIDEDIYHAMLLYGNKEETKISYQIRSNYRTSTWGKDIEDEFVQEYELEVEGTTMYMKQYLVEGNVERWMVSFEYQEVNYSMVISDESQEEVEKIVNDLYFP